MINPSTKLELKETLMMDKEKLMKARIDNPSDEVIKKQLELVLKYIDICERRNRF